MNRNFLSLISSSDLLSAFLFIKILPVMSYTLELNNSVSLKTTANYFLIFNILEDYTEVSL